MTGPSDALLTHPIPSPAIRALDAAADAAAVTGLFDRAADYAHLETGEPPPPDAAARFFADAPPGGTPAGSLKLGLWEGARLQGLADLAFGYPERADAYLGLLLLAPEARGGGSGALSWPRSRRGPARGAPRGSSSRCWRRTRAAAPSGSAKGFARSAASRPP